MGWRPTIVLAACLAVLLAASAACDVAHERDGDGSPVRTEGGASAGPRTEIAEVAIESAAPGVLPEIRGIDFDGNPVAIVPDGREKVILVVAHWERFSQLQIPVLVEWLNEVGLRDDLDLFVVSTMADPERDNYPPSAWLAREGLQVPVLVDDSESSAFTHLGFETLPGWLLVNSDGTINYYIGGYTDHPLGFVPDTR